MASHTRDIDAYMCKIRNFIILCVLSAEEGCPHTTMMIQSDDTQTTVNS